MGNLYFRDVFGNTAVILCNQDGTFRLVCRDKEKKKWKDQPYKKLHGAKTALGMYGPWIEVFPKQATKVAIN
jgi:hypothetical protein